MSSEYLRSNPLAEHNSGIALSSKELPPPQAGGTGNMYQGQGGRAFVQGGGGMSQYHSFADDGQDKSYANGSYAPVTVGYNSVTRGGRRRGRGSKRKLRRKTKRSKKCNCDIVTGFGGRSRGYKRKCHIKKCKCSCHSHSRSRSRSRKYKQQGGSGFANAAYSIGGADTGVGRDTSALANPAPYTAYNSCHPVA
jgi:hypothetical protein